jgi:hypothetical protein
MSPCSAISRNVTRERPNWRRKARGRPVIEHRLRIRVADESRGRLRSFDAAACFSSSLAVWLTIVAFSAARFSAYRATICLRSSFLTTLLVLAVDLLEC